MPRAVASVRQQTHDHWELIIEDDGSTDGTRSLLASLIRDDRRIIACSHERRGPGASRNHGLTHAQGDFITYIDSDDEFTPDHLALRLAWMAEHPGVDMVHGGVRVVGSSDSHYVRDADDGTRRIRIEDCAIGGTFFFRAGTARAHVRWSDAYAEDHLLLRQLENRCVVARVSFPTYIYHRDTGGSRCDDAGQEVPIIRL